MPNWCSNTLTIYGTEDKTAPVCESMKGVLYSQHMVSATGKISTIEYFTEPTPFSFHSVIPQPDHMLDECDPRRTGSPAKSDELIATLANTGGVMPDWYNWRCEKWGTKWDLSADNIFVEKRSRSVLYSFETAWSPPYPVVAALSAKFPSVKMRIQFQEGGMGIKGSITYLGGKVVGATGDGEEAYEYEGQYGGKEEALVGIEGNKHIDNPMPLRPPVQPC